MSEHAVPPQPPVETAAFDATEPKARFIAIFGITTIIALIAMILGVQAYVDHLEQQQIFVKQLQPVAPDLLALHAREDQDLDTYQYIDRAKGEVRIPIGRAMDLLASEYARHELFYPDKPVPVAVADAQANGTAAPARKGAAK
jgi:hypothetical protein